MSFIHIRGSIVHDIYMDLLEPGPNTLDLWPHICWNLGTILITADLFFLSVVVWVWSGVALTTSGRTSGCTGAGTGRGCHGNVNVNVIDWYETRCSRRGPHCPPGDIRLGHQGELERGGEVRYTVEPLNNRHIGMDHFVHYREVVLL